MNPSAEFELLVCCARVSLDDEQAARARALLRGGLDWQRLMALAWRHGLMPLAFKHILTHFADDAPEAVREQMRADYAHNTARCVWLSAELQAALAALGRAGISAAAYKGPDLALRAYGDIRLRTFVDLDIMVRRGDVERAGAVLGSLGYRPHLPLSRAQEEMIFGSECDRVFLKEGRNIVLELHWAVVPPYYGIPLDVEELLGASPSPDRPAGRPGGASDGTLLLLLCINGAKDFWQRLEQVCAVGELLRAGRVEWGPLMRSASRIYAIRALLIGLSAANRLLGAPLPEEVARRIAADRAAARLADEVIRRLASGDGLEPGLREKTRFRLAAMDRARDRVRYCAARSLTPTHRDYVAWLPPALSLVYYGLRPVRILREALRPK
ncbi:MAG TPA: nucleotidyltransferase family protein [Pyrinomonadaceae bacterium]